MAAIFKSEEGRKSIISMYDLLLARWPVPFETHYLKTKYGETGLLVLYLASRLKIPGFHHCGNWGFLIPLNFLANIIDILAKFVYNIAKILIKEWLA